MIYREADRKLTAIAAQIMPGMVLPIHARERTHADTSARIYALKARSKTFAAFPVFLGPPWIVAAVRVLQAFRWSPMRERVHIYADTHVRMGAKSPVEHFGPRTSAGSCNLVRDLFRENPADLPGDSLQICAARSPFNVQARTHTRTGIRTQECAKRLFKQFAGFPG